MLNVRPIGKSIAHYFPENFKEKIWEESWTVVHFKILFVTKRNQPHIV